MSCETEEAGGADQAATGSRDGRRALRILHFQPMTLDLYGHKDEDLGGPVRYSVTNLATALSRRGNVIEVHLLTSGAPMTFEREGVRYRFHRCLQPPVRPVRVRFGRQLSWSMIRAIRTGVCDLVHFHGVSQFHGMYGALACRAAREGVPFVAQHRGMRPVGLIERFAQSIGLSRSRMVMASSEGSRVELLGHGVPDNSIRVVSNGVDLQMFTPEEPASLPDRTLRVIYVSRLSGEKDPITMVEGVKEFARRGHKVEVTVISDGDLREQVLGSLAAAGIPADHLPFVAQPDLAVHYRRSHVYVVTSRAEGWNQTVLEAMACGTPVVHTDAVGVRDSAGEAGMPVPVGSPTAIADALEAICSNETLRLELRRRGIERARAFSWDAVAARVEGIYREVIQDHRRSLSEAR